MQNTARSYKDYIEVTTLPLLIKHIRKNIFNNILFKLKNKMRSIKIGDIIARFITIPIAVKDIITDISVLILPKVFKILIVLSISLFINYKVGLINLITILLIIVILYYKNNDCFRFHYLNNEKFNQVNQILQNKLYNIFNIIISNNIKQEIINNNKREELLYDIYFNSKNVYGLLIYTLVLF